MKKGNVLCPREHCNPTDDANVLIWLITALPLQKESHLQIDFRVKHSTEESLVNNCPGKRKTIFIHFHFFK